MKKSIIFLFLIISVNCFGQESLPITFEKVLELAGANNLTIQSYKEKFKLSEVQLAKAKEWWLPEVYTGAQTHQLSGAVMNSNGKFYLDVDRNNLWLGLGLSANWKLSDGLLGTKSARLSSKSMEYLSVAERNKVLMECIGAYYDLMSSQLTLEAYTSLVGQANTIVDQIQIQVDAGLRYQSEVLLAKSNKNHLKVEMLNAKNTYNKASSKLINILNLDHNIILVSVDKQLLPLVLEEHFFSSTNESHNRPELKANEYEIRSLKVLKKSYTTGLLLPEINIGANTSYYGTISGDVIPVNSVLYPNPNQLYPTRVFNGSLLWKIPLGALIYKGDVRKYNSLIRLKKIESEQLESHINKEINDARSQLILGKDQIEVAKEGLDLTTMALNQSIERQKLGTAKPFEVFQAQQFFLQSKIDYIKAVSDFNKAQFALKVARGDKL